MAWTITITVEDKEDRATACREVADLIEGGYSGGLIGCSGDTWCSEEV